jgi:putative membrane protein insertion efficiency factor
MTQLFKKLISAPRYFFVALIDIYQHTLSPDHSWLKARFPYGFCRHYPTCSEYSRQSILKFGLLKGGLLSAKRLSSCHPWAEPQVDLVPETKV